MRRSFAVLHVQPPSGPGRLVLTRLPAAVGRADDADVYLGDPEVSSVHARIDLQGGQLVLVDLGSANGLWRGADRVAQAVLVRGEELRLGQTRLRLVQEAEERSEVLRVHEAERGAQAPRIVRLPTQVGLDASGGLRLGQPGAIVAEAGVLVFQREVLLLLRANPRSSGGIEVSRESGAGGLLQVGRFRIDRVESGTQPLDVATDLGFGDKGQVLRLQSLDRPGDAFPPPCFSRPQVTFAQLRQTGLPLLEQNFLALGAGVGSFCWVDALRVHGVDSRQIRVVGFEPIPYARYARLCSNSQIPMHERLRSNSESCPDNYWGFPGYGLREAWKNFKGGRIGTALGVLGQLYGEPDKRQTYTPIAGEVFSSIDREAARIGWDGMFQRGRIRAIRQTTDGRYAVAVSSREDSSAERAIYLAPFVHLALGYPGLQFLPDLRAYRERSGDFDRVVNAYEEHEHLYARLREGQRTVVLRGRGIVASRVLQRIYEIRQQGGDVRVLHLMRTPRPTAQQAGRARRRVDNHWEFQPFNWPEACWGGDLRGVLEQAPPSRREELLKSWGGTTTADRRDWRQMVSEGLRAGWYSIVFGGVSDLSGDARGLTLRVSGSDREHVVTCDYVLDATGLISKIRVNPVLADLVDTYSLELNVQGRLQVEPSFEILPLRNGHGRLFAAGVATLGGPYAPVDSFLGLQYAAAASLDALVPAVPPLSRGGSYRAWRRWTRGVAP